MNQFASISDQNWFCFKVLRIATIIAITSNLFSCSNPCAIECRMHNVKKMDAASFSKIGEDQKLFGPIFDQNRIAGSNLLGASVRVRFTQIINPATSPTAFQQRNNPWILRGGSEEDDQKQQSIGKDMEELKKFALSNGLPLPNDGPECIDEDKLREAFPGGNGEGLDDPRIQYLAQILPAISKQSDEETPVFWPGDRVLVSPMNPMAPSYNATVVDLPLILQRETPLHVDAHQFQYRRYQRRFETCSPRPKVLSEEDFIERFYPEIDWYRHTCPHASPVFTVFGQLPRLGHPLYLCIVNLQSACCV
jgi:hypothetical protein